MGFIPTSDDLKRAAESAHTAGLLTEHEYADQIEELRTMPEEATNARVLRFFRNAAGASITIGIAEQRVKHMVQDAEERVNRVKQFFYLDVSQVDRLKRRSRETGAPISELIRRAIDAYSPLAQTTEEEEE